MLENEYPLLKQYLSAKGEDSRLVWESAKKEAKRKDLSPKDKARAMIEIECIRLLNPGQNLLGKQKILNNIRNNYLLPQVKAGNMSSDFLKEIESILGIIKKD